MELTAKGADLCRQCHEGVGSSKPFIHEPVKEGACTSCHNPHGAAARFLLAVGSDRTPLCLNCHEAQPFRQKYVHGVVAVGACESCHDPHAAAEKSLMKGKSRDICLACHADLAKQIKDAVVIHRPVAEPSCTGCHDPHGSTNRILLTKDLPDLCLGCHKKVGELIASAKVPHKPVAEGNCTNCHSAHAGKTSGLLPADQEAVCLGCHGTDDLGQPTLSNIAKEIEGKKYLHGPLQKGNCKACHAPHGSDYFRLLRGNYPAEIYAPYNDGAYDACLGCHERRMLRFSETTTHTGFRNGSTNLHYLHVVSRKGRTCRICHEPHASDDEKLIRRDGAQFGSWQIPINFKVTPTGGSCAPGCHRKLSYDRQNPQTY